MEAQIKCEHCGYIWITNSGMMMVTCPNCQKKTKRKCLNCECTETIHHADKDKYQCKECGQIV